MDHLNLCLSKNTRQNTTFGQEISSVSRVNENTWPNFFSDHPIHPPKSSGDPWDCEFPPDLNDFRLKMKEGIMWVYRSESDLNEDNPVVYEFPKLAEFVSDMHLLCALIADGPLKSFCYRRLSYLSSKFQLHVLLNELRELAAQKAVAHRDFYNVRKVRNHFNFLKCCCTYIQDIITLYTMLHLRTICLGFANFK